MFLTINVPNVKRADATVQLSDEGRVYFKGQAGNVGHEDNYLLDISLFKPIKADESKFTITARAIRFKIIKADPGPYWDRLLKMEGRNVHCKIDWDHWKDEDEDEDEYSFGSHFAENKDLQDMDFVSGTSTSEEEEDDEVEATVDATEDK